MNIADEAAMHEYGEKLASELRAGDIVAIDGPLGAGKTVLCRGILSGLGFADEVSSPSYAIMHEYHPPDTRLPVIHADLYRIENSDEFTELGLLDDIGEAILLVEWAERFAGLSARAVRHISIDIEEGGARRLSII